MISTRDLTSLPDVDRLRAVLQSMAMLDAILCPEWEYRYYSFNARWSAHEQMASMRNGSGDQFFAVFNAAGCWIKGFAHEAPMSPYSRAASDPIWPGVLDDVPAEFAGCLTEPAFMVAEETTFCIWRRYIDTCWQRGRIEFPSNDHDPDGSQELLSPLDGDPKTYQSWAEADYEREVNLSAVVHVYAHRLLTDNLILLLNPRISRAALQADILEIGYPVGSVSD